MMDLVDKGSLIALKGSAPKLSPPNSLLLPRRDSDIGWWARLFFTRAGRGHRLSIHWACQWLVACQRRHLAFHFTKRYFLWILCSIVVCILRFFVLKKAIRQLRTSGMNQKNCLQL
ncbi:hypothetical protein O181_076856 [Austropuccinia psidii MF-1]|uniref:Uncharacterized protein n=1 Tax=Austropuccinia psidii MF-1 TaxID=1389203 RepID=A0A9Q3FH13_9BASI|nr:hypothetical protein [Austropuccinia psidii MF-1]